MNKTKKAELIVALDVETFEEARMLIDALKDDVQIFKVGSQLFTAYGPVVVRHIMALGKKVFLDLKFHDIPNTVGNAVASAVGLGQSMHDVLDEDGNKMDVEQGLFMLTVHTIGGEEMLRAAVVQARKQAEILKIKAPLIVGITVLTSDKSQDNIQTLVLERAKLAKSVGLDGVVASSQEAALIRQELGTDFIIVTPGIRPADDDAGDQKRVATPREAVANGSHFLVVGRPIVKADNPKQAAQNILKEIQNVK